MNRMKSAATSADRLSLPHRPGQVRAHRSSLLLRSAELQVASRILSAMPRLRLALLVAPLLAPLTVVAGAATHSLSSGFRGVAAGSIAAIVLLTVVMIVYGAPLAYGGTICVLWPAAVLLREVDALSWWALSLIGATGGGILFPLYLHLLAPRATWSFFPGAGFAAGAVTGWGFWFIATRQASA